MPSRLSPEDVLRFIYLPHVRSGKRIPPTSGLHLQWAGADNTITLSEGLCRLSGGNRRVFLKLFPFGVHLDLRENGLAGEPARSDDEIMREAADACPAAFSTLFERYHGRVYAYLRRLVGPPGGAEAAHDLTQETFLLAFRSRERYRPKGCFRAWLFRIATNLARMHLRRTREDRRLDAAEDPEACHASPSAVAEALETRSCMAAALERLPDEQREVVLLKVVQALTFREVAEALEISESTAKSRMRYALEKLSSILRPMERELR